MRSADLSIAVLAVVAVAGSLVGVALWDEPGLQTWTVTVESQESESVEVYEETGVGTAPREKAWQLAVANVTGAEFAIQVTGDATARPNAITVEVTITAPNGTTGRETVTLDSPNTNSGTGSIAITLGAPPEGGDVEAENATAALDAQAPTTMNGTGNWEISARVSQGGGGILMGIGGETVDVRVTAIYTFYRADAAIQSVEVGGA